MADAQLARDELEPLDYDVRPLYRTRKPIAYKRSIIPANSLHRLEKITPAGIEKLKARGTISEVQPPPLSVLQGWSRRAQKLARYGIENAQQFLGVDVAAAALAMNVKPQTIRRWQLEIEGWMKAPRKRG